MEEFEYSGLWWLPSNPQEKVTGTIKFSYEEGIYLEIVGRFNELENFSTIPQSKPEIILGITHGKLFTLLNCSRNTNRISFPGITTEKYLVSVGFLGHHFNTSEEIKFKHFQVGFTYLQYLTTLFYKVESEEIIYENNISFKKRLLSITGANDLKASITKGNIVVTQFLERETNHHKISFSNSALISVTIEQELSLDEILKLFIQPLRNFITLVSNKTNNITKIFLYFQEDEARQKGIEVIFKTPNYINPKVISVPENTLLELDDIREHFGLIMQRWFNFFEKAEDIINLYFSTIYNPNLYVENQFLSLVQTLESYHRRMIDKSNSFTEAHQDRLKNILDSVSIEHKAWLEDKLLFSHEPSLLDRLRGILSLTSKTTDPIIGNTENLAKKIKNLRNYFTHYNDIKQGKSIDIEQIIRINQLLNFAIKACFLNELGCSPERCEELISRSSQYEFLKQLKSQNKLNFN